MSGTTALMASYGAAAAAGYDADATTYMNAVTTAGGSLTTGQKDGINRWFLDMKGTANGSYSTYNVFARLKVAYLYTQGASAARDCINAVNPGTYNGTDTGSPTYSSSNLTVAFNGSSQYTNTAFTPNGEFTTFANSDFTMYGYHRVDTNADTNATIGETGGGNSYTQIGGTLAANRIQVLSAAQADGTGSGTHNINGLWSCGWISSTSLNAYYNGANIKNTTPTWGNTPNRSAYLGAFHTAGVGYGGATTQDHYYCGKDAWTDNEQQMMYNAGKALKVTLGGTAWA